VNPISICRAVSASIALCFATTAGADIRVGETTVLGPFIGHHAPLHPDNAKSRIEFYGTDLGWTYVHKGRLQFLFGDTWKNEKGEPIDKVHDDIFGTIDLRDWPDGKRISTRSVPTVKLATLNGSGTLAPLDAGLPSEGLKTPVGGFSDGENEFALFITGKPQACRTDADCSSGRECETSVGFFGEKPGTAAGLTLACEEGSTGCVADTLFDEGNQPIKNTGLCADRTSSLWTDSASGRTSATTMEHIVAIRDAKDPAKYRKLTNWHTTKFINVAMRTLDDFEPRRGAGRARNDYRNATTQPSPKQRVLLWGRSEFIGVNAKTQTLALYFAYADIPRAPDFEWKPHFFAGTNADGTLRFSDNERDAQAVDLDATQDGVQSREIHDIIQHMSIVWLESLQQWVMFYGGGINDVPQPPIFPTCGLLEVFARTECKHVDQGNGAIRVRVANDPWGPWSPPQDVFVGGDAKRRPLDAQYGAGGVLHHPECVGEKCQSRSPSLPPGDYGWLYGANIIEPWTTTDAKGVDLIWIASTWNPYRVILLKTRLEKN